MKPRRPFPSFAFFAFILLLLPTSARAQDSICYVLMRVPKQEAPILRFEMASAKADHFSEGEDFFASTRGARRVVFIGTLDIAGKQRGEMKKYLPPSLAFNGPWDKTETRMTLAAVKSGDPGAAMLRVDANFDFRGKEPDIAVWRGGSVGGFHAYTASSLVPLRPNAWQEVAVWSIDHYCLMLWQYPLLKAKHNPAVAAKPATAPPLALEAAPAFSAPHFRLEMTIGVLPEESLAQMDTYTTKRKNMIAESYPIVSNQWSSFSIHCPPGQPFKSGISRGMKGKLRHEGYFASATSSFSGTLALTLGGVALKSEFQVPAPEKKDRIIIPIHADLIPGEWHIQSIPEQPVIYDVGHDARERWEETPPGHAPHKTVIRANAAFIRVVEVQP